MRQTRGLAQLEPATDRDIGEVAHAQRSGELHLAAGPGRQRRHDPVPQLRGLADQPGKDCGGNKDKRNNAEKKPFPNRLPTLHPGLIHPFRHRAEASAQLVSDRSKAFFLARLARDGEPKA
jgi:hypothetical protein